MSLEEKLAANTAAMEANTAALAEVLAAWNKLAAQATTLKSKADSGQIDGITAGGVPVADIKPEKAAAAPKAEKPAPTPPAPTTVTPPPVEVAAPVPATESRSEATMEQLSAAVTSAATRNRDAVIKLLSERGVKRASELPKDQWADIIAVLGTF